MTAIAEKKFRFVSLLITGALSCGSVENAHSQLDWKKEWERSLQGAKKEGQIVVGIPARAELRKELEKVFKPKFGVEMELMTARGPQKCSHFTRLAAMKMSPTTP